MTDSNSGAGLASDVAVSPGTGNGPGAAPVHRGGAGTVVLIHSGAATEDVAVRNIVQPLFPEVTFVTAGTRAEVQEHLPHADVLFAWDFPVDLLALGERLRWFQVMGAGLERLQGAPLPDGVTVTNVRGVFGDAMAEYALTYILAFAQDTRGVMERQDAAEWLEFVPRLLRGSTVGVLGLGSIGQVVAERCAQFGMRVLGLRRTPGNIAGVEQVYTIEQVEELLPQCDWLVSVLPHTSDTTDLLRMERLRLLKPGCVLINMGRGNLAPLDDLVAALEDGTLGGAALDVFPTEPLPPDHPLWHAPNVVVTPHISGVNRPEDVTTIFSDNLLRYLSGEALQNVADLRRGY